MRLDWDTTKSYQVKISREKIEQCTDIAMLCDWYLLFDQRAVEIKSFSDAYREVELEDEEWFKRNGRALGHVKIGMRWIERRILTLGGDPPYPPTDPRSRQLRILTEKLDKLQRQVEGLERVAA